MMGITSYDVAKWRDLYCHAQAKLEAEARAAVEAERALVQRALEAERRTAELHLLP